MEEGPELFQCCDLSVLKPAQGDGPAEEQMIRSHHNSLSAGPTTPLRAFIFIVFSFIFLLKIIEINKSTKPNTLI